MKIARSIVLAGVLWATVLTVPVSAYTYYGSHITALPPWINRIDVYNNGYAPGTFTLTTWDSQGQQVSSGEYLVGPNAVTSVVLSAYAGYVPAPGESVLTAVEGTCTVTTSSERVRPKLSFRYGDSLSLCEFFMQDALAWEYVLPNTIQAHFIGTGIAVMNPFDNTLTVQLLAFRLGELVGNTGPMQIAPHTKLVSISEGIWPGLGAADFDLVRIGSTQAGFPTPMSITWDQLNDRHVFFNAAPTAQNPSLQPGDLVITDPIVGNLMYVPAGTLTQGSPSDEPCRGADETQFVHTLSRDMAVMATEVSRQMWADLKVVQPNLPDDPTLLAYSSGLDNPVLNITWYDAVLFANLLSTERGLPRCYWADENFTTPIDATNYTDGPFYCDWASDGYRLLREGEWEYCCRAGTTSPYWIAEPNYSSDSCTSCTPGLLPNLESVAVFCANTMGTTAATATKAANPWSLYDTHGNVWEWCWDWYGAYPSGSATDYHGPPADSYRVLRGGGWYNYERLCRSAQRSALTPDNHFYGLGFRLAKSLP